MNQITRVLTAVDFSASARAAFEHALALSRRRDAELTVVHAVPGDRAFRWRARERIALIGKLRQAAKTAGVRFRVSVQHGDPARVILEMARVATDVDADLILVGVTRRGAIGRRIFGSTVARLIRGAGRPVLAIPELTKQRRVPRSDADQLVIAA